MQVPYTTEPMHKAPTVLSLALDLLLAVTGAAVIVGASLYTLGVLK